MPASSHRRPTEANHLLEEAPARRILWPGCHGVRLEPAEQAEGYGRASGHPLLEATLVAGPVGPPGERELWHLVGELELPSRRVPYDQRLTRRTDETFVLEAGRASLHVDTTSRRVTVEAEGESAAKQLVTTYGLPLLLASGPACVLHACAATPPGRAGALVVCGSSGVGKSGLLVALIAAGWQPVSEDVCVVDLRGHRPLVWPGPPWVRRREGGPPGATALFRTVDKTAWDIAPRQAVRPMPIDRLVFMEPAGGDGTVWEHIATAEAIPRFVHHNVWLGWPENRAETTFGPAVRIAGSIPSTRLRLRVDPGWAETAVSLLETLAFET